MRYRKLFIGAVITGTYGIMRFAAKKYAEDEHINDDNPYLNSGIISSGERGNTKGKRKLYGNAVKPALDHILSFCGLIVLCPLYGVIALAIKIDDPGPIFFTQKRIGKDKTYFICHKFRTMKMSTPHDIPTHLLSDPEEYITHVGRRLRKKSLDELPQIWDIFRGKMSIIGPRPALWNQDDLVAEREKYRVNDVMPGLTGLAQISGRDELEIPEKARLDGEYVNHIGFLKDVKYFFGTIVSVLRHDGVVEGGTGRLHANSAKLSYEK